MLNGLFPRRLRPHLPVALPAAALLALAACATSGPGPGIPQPDPTVIYHSLFGSNPGLSTVRAVVEARIAYAGRSISLPGVLLLDAFDGFRIDLLDPLDRPQALLYPENGRIIQYRPVQRIAASLGLFPVECGRADPAAWVTAVIASSLGPVPGEQLADRRGWGKERNLERWRNGELYQNVRYRVEGERHIPVRISWYCGDEAIMEARLAEWIAGTSWRLPGRIEIAYPKAGLEVRLELREIEGNPPPSGQALRPRPGTEVRWTTWNLPQ